jgi:glycosyltransferase involved in cell wall biosynthesis
MFLFDLAAIASAHRSDARRVVAGGLIKDVAELMRILRAHRARDPGPAVKRSLRLLRRYPRLRWPLRIVAADDVRHGELTAGLAVTRRLLDVDDTAASRRQEERIVDRLAETEPGWRPTIAGPGRPVEPRARNVVMHLLKASLPDRQSGYTIRSRETLRAQVDAGLEPFVVTPYGYPGDRADGQDPVVEVVDGIRHHRLAPGADIERMSPAEILSRTARSAALVVQQERPAIIHAASGHRGYELALVGLALREHLARPLVYEVRGFLEASWTGDSSVAETAETAELTRRRYAMEDEVMAAADGITTLGVAMRDELVERGVPAHKIIVVPNGIDPAAFAPTVADPALRARYGLDGRWVFGYVSNMDHFREGHRLLIEATARLVADGRNVACLLVGDGSLRPQLEASVAAAGLGDSVIFTGRVPHEEVGAHYALLDAFVIARVPDRAATFVTPLKPYEAMATGVPIVVSDLPALTEIAARDERGLVFPAGDADALAATLARLMDHPEQGARLASTARTWVLAERTWAANGPRYRDFYASILERFDPAVIAEAVAAGGERPRT